MKIDLLSGDYQSRSILGGNQRKLNLYSEMIDPKSGEPSQIVHYPTPGLRLLATVPNGKPLRGLYRASNGDLYGAAGMDIYYIDAKFVFHLVGTMNSTGNKPVKFADNGTSVVLCDGTTAGYSINMAVRVGLAPLFDPDASDAETTSSTGWLGSNHLDFVDTFLIANSPGTPTFYISNSEDVIFDPLQFASKSAYPDVLLAAIVQHRVIWLIGVLTSEVWYNTGGGSTLANNFPFELMPGVAIDWGCAAQYSIAKAETSVFWLGQHQNGEIVVLRGTGYSVKRISTHAIEQIFSGYVLTDCLAYCCLMLGHTWYVMNFPSSNATWAFDLSTEHWHQLAWVDDSGIENRHRATMHAFAYDLNVVNDWQLPNLYALDPLVFTDVGRPIKRLLNFPRMIEAQDDRRQVFRHFVAEVDVGQTLDMADNTTMMLSFSDDKGRTYSNAIPQSLGRIGEFNKFVKWQRLGLSRNRVFRLEWQANSKVALVGAFVDVIPGAS